MKFKQYLLESNIRSSLQKSMGLKRLVWDTYEGPDGTIYEWSDKHNRFLKKGDKEHTDHVKITSLKRRESELTLKVAKMRKDHDGDRGHFENELRGIQKQIEALNN